MAQRQRKGGARNSPKSDKTNNSSSWGAIDHMESAARRIDSFFFSVNIVSNMSNIYAIVLAAGKGKRMNSKALPKILYPLAGRPMLAYVLEMLKEAGVAKIIIVVGFLAKKVEETFGPSYTYVHQRKRLGTGHAVVAAKPVLEGKDGCTLIMYGDQPFFKPSSIKRSIEAVTVRGATVAVMTGLMKSQEFDAFGRVLTDQTGHVLRIVEVKDATENEKKVRLMNLGGYAVDNKWLWRVLPKIKKSRVSGEYYITDIVGEAVKEGKKVISIQIEDKAEAIGINTHEHLEEAERLFKSQHS